MPAREHKTFALDSVEFKAGAAEGVFSGYASTWAKDSYGDRIQPGAFAESIKSTRGKIPIFLNHSDSEWAGFSTSLAEDHKGLLIEGQLVTSEGSGRNAWALLQMAQKIDYKMGLSIGFIAQEWDMDGDARTLKSIDLWETSLTPFPANRLARVEAIKSVPDFEKLLVTVGGCSEEEAAAIIAQCPRLKLDSRTSPASHHWALRRFIDEEKRRLAAAE
jgi:HK97 family phage prohead protease